MFGIEELSAAAAAADRGTAPFDCRAVWNDSIVA